MSRGLGSVYRRQLIILLTENSRDISWGKFTIIMNFWITIFITSTSPPPRLDTYKTVDYLSHLFLYAINWTVKRVRSVSIDLLCNYAHFAKFSMVTTIWILKY